MQEVAAEINQAETAFLLTTPGSMSIWWFTPTTEISLCGHATLAAATAFWHHSGSSETRLDLASASGSVSVEQTGDGLQLDFPQNVATEAPVPEVLRQQLEPCKWFGQSARQDCLAVLASPEAVRDFQPDMEAIGLSGPRGLIVTAASGQGTFALRFFAPQLGVPEDHATGSAQTVAAPYWAGQMGTDTLECHQVSPRGAILNSRVVADRVLISGRSELRVKGLLEA